MWVQYLWDASGASREEHERGRYRRRERRVPVETVPELVRNREQAQYNLAVWLQKEAAAQSKGPGGEAGGEAGGDRGDEYAKIASASKLLRKAAAQGHAKAAAALRQSLPLHEARHIQ